MSSGTVKFFNTISGFGIIAPDDGSKDVFVHISAVEEAGLNILTEGQKVEYEVVSRLAASLVELIGYYAPRRRLPSSRSKSTFIQMWLPIWFCS